MRREEPSGSSSTTQEPVTPGSDGPGTSWRKSIRRAAGSSVRRVTHEVTSSQASAQIRRRWSAPSRSSASTCTVGVRNSGQRTASATSP
ncbi:hypothetical protein SCALM49S_07763 [Streptomyces californicus]